MCVGAALLGAGKAATAFNIGLGLTAANAFLGRSAKQQAARQTYQTALAANRSAEENKRQQQLALAERKSEQEKSSFQDIFARNIQALQARSSILSTERAGTSIGLLLRDNERQSANYRESINQSLESMNRQYAFNIEATESQFDSTRNDLQSNINQAYNQIPSRGQTLLNIGTQGVGLYMGARV